MFPDILSVPAPLSVDESRGATALQLVTLNINAASGAAGVGWVQALVAAHTACEIDIINASWQFGVDVTAAGTDLASSIIGAEDGAAKDLIDIEANRSIAIAEKSADIEQKKANAQQIFELNEHGAAETPGLIANAEQNTLEKALNDAEETRTQGIASESNNLTRDLAGFEETRQLAYVSADGTFLTDGAAAEAAATALAATAQQNLTNNLFGAYSGLVTAATPLIASAVQSFNNSFHNTYINTVGNTLDQIAVSAAHRDYNNADATASTLLTASASGALTTYITNTASNVAAAMNAIAAQSATLAASRSTAITGYANIVGPAVTVLTGQRRNTCQTQWNATPGDCRFGRWDAAGSRFRFLALVAGTSVGST